MFLCAAWPQGVHIDLTDYMGNTAITTPSCFALTVGCISQHVRWQKEKANLLEMSHLPFCALMRMKALWLVRQQQFVYCFLPPSSSRYLLIANSEVLDVPLRIKVPLKSTTHSDERIVTRLVQD